VLSTSCDIPTQVPSFTTEWQTILLSDSVSTGELLPDNVRLAEGGGFVVDSYESSNDVRLGEVCEFCTCFQGPIPELEFLPYDWRFKLPPRLLEASVERGVAHLKVTNDAGFDVLDDGEGNLGFLIIELVDLRTNSVVRSQLVQQSFPQGDSLEISFDLGGLTLGSSMVARVSGRTPGTECEVELTAESGFKVKATLEDLVAPAVRAVLVDSDLFIPPRDFDLPSEVASRLRPGDASVFLDVDISAALPVGTEFELSVAADPTELFTEHAALYTPIVVPATSEELTLRKTFVVDVTTLASAERLYVSTRNRILDSPIVTLKGGESVRYRITLRAEIPTR